MGFFDKIKKGLGIGTVKVEMNLPTTNFPKTTTSIEGEFTLTSKGENMEILSAEIVVEEEYKTGSGDNEKTTTFTLGKEVLKDTYVMQKDEQKTVKFTVPITLAKGSIKSPEEAQGFVGGLTKVASFLSNAQSTFSVHVKVDVKDVALDPTDKAEIMFQ